LVTHARVNLAAGALRGRRETEKPLAAALFGLLVRPRDTPNSLCDSRRLLELFGSGGSRREHATAGDDRVFFKQHPSENCISRCSKCLFFVAWGTAWV